MAGCCGTAGGFTAVLGLCGLLRAVLPLSSSASPSHRSHL